MQSNSIIERVQKILLDAYQGLEVIKNEPPTNENEPPTENTEGVRECVDFWNERLANTNREACFEQLTYERTLAVDTILKKNTRQEILDVLDYVNATPSLKGKNTRGWSASFGWVFTPKNFDALKLKALPKQKKE